MQQSLIVDYRRILLVGLLVGKVGQQAGREGEAGQWAEPGIEIANVRFPFQREVRSIRGLQQRRLVQLKRRVRIQLAVLVAPGGQAPVGELLLQPESVRALKIGRALVDGLRYRAVAHVRAAGGEMVKLAAKAVCERPALILVIQIDFNRMRGFAEVFAGGT